MPTRPMSKSETKPMREDAKPAPTAVAGVHEALLVTDRLVKEYRQRAWSTAFPLRVGPGEIVGLLGPNGAGKTTTFNMVVGVIKPDGGAVGSRAQTSRVLPMHRRARLGMGYLTQEPSIFRKLTVEQNILAILETCRLTRAERGDTAEVPAGGTGHGAAWPRARPTR